MNLYAVFGYPITHSLSPRIHAQFGRQLGIALTYERRAVPAGSLAAAVQSFREEGGRGANVTVPLKTEAYALASTRTPRAERAGAVNTLTFRDDVIAGDNTDGDGLLADLAYHKVALPGARLLLMGAGGAAQGIIGPLLDAGVDRIAVWNRTQARVQEWLARLRDDRLREPVPGDSYDIVINATAASLGHALPPVPDAVFRGALVYDLAYGPVAGRFLAHAQAQGAGRVLDGLGMLIEQAATAFCVWHGVRPDTTDVRALLRGETV
ncbi:MAG: shikimate dehydrogenase [Gammaproteobacteria bacterium]|nr:shikimate dehydrogenase [Gammaproteobacteria bacterium]